MTFNETELLFKRAFMLAESLNHAYCTVEHLIVVAYRDQRELFADVIQFINDNTPALQSGETLNPTLGFQRVVKRITIEGFDLISAIAAEGPSSRGLLYLAKHGVPLNTNAI